MCVNRLIADLLTQTAASKEDDESSLPYDNYLNGITSKDAPIIHCFSGNFAWVFSQPGENNDAVIVASRLGGSGSTAPKPLPEKPIMRRDTKTRFRLPASQPSSPSLASLAGACSSIHQTSTTHCILLPEAATLSAASSLGARDLLINSYSVHHPAILSLQHVPQAHLWLAP